MEDYPDFYEENIDVVMMAERLGFSIKERNILQKIVIWRVEDEKRREDLGICHYNYD